MAALRDRRWLGVARAGRAARKNRLIKEDTNASMHCCSSTSPPEATPSVPGTVLYRVHYPVQYSTGGFVETETCGIDLLQDLGSH
jgi:hypothetical protein